MNNDKNEDRLVSVTLEEGFKELRDANAQYSIIVIELQKEIEKWKGMYDVISKREQGKDEKIEVLRTKADWQRETIQSLKKQLAEKDKRTEFIVGNNDLYVSELKEEISTLKSLIAQARPYVKHCGELNFMSKFLPDIKEWIEKTEGMK